MSHHESDAVEQVDIARWNRHVNDEYAALLCATVERLVRASTGLHRAGRHEDAIEAQQAGDEAREDMVDWFGPTLTEQPAIVRRLAGLA